MVNLTIDPAVDVTQACVRRRFRFSSCRACADVCPAQAFSLAQGQVSIDTTRCIACGDCLFVCPVDAITGINRLTLCAGGYVGGAVFATGTNGR